MQVVRLPGLRTWNLLVPLLCLIPGIVSGAVEDFIGKSIGQIAFEPKRQPLTPDELAGILPLKKNEPLRLAAVREAIERLYATGRYSDIVVEANLEENLVVLRFVTKGTWFVGRVSVESVPFPPSTEQLAYSTNLGLGSPFHTEDVRASHGRPATGSGEQRFLPAQDRTARPA